MFLLPKIVDFINVWKRSALQMKIDLWGKEGATFVADLLPQRPPSIYCQVVISKIDIFNLDTRDIRMWFSNIVEKLLIFGFFRMIKKSPIFIFWASRALLEVPHLHKLTQQNSSGLFTQKSKPTYIVFVAENCWFYWIFHVILYFFLLQLFAF